MLEQNSNNLMRISNKAKQTIHAMDIHDSEYVMTCTTKINSISNIFKNLLLRSDLNSFYIKTIYNDKDEITKVNI